MVGYCIVLGIVGLVGRCDGCGGGAVLLPQHRRPIKHCIPLHYDLCSHINTLICLPTYLSTHLTYKRECAGWSACPCVSKTFANSLYPKSEVENPECISLNVQKNCIESPETWLLTGDWWRQRVRKTFDQRQSVCRFDQREDWSSGDVISIMRPRVISVISIIG